MTEETTQVLDFFVLFIEKKNTKWYSVRNITNKKPSTLIKRFSIQPNHYKIFNNRFYFSLESFKNENSFFQSRFRYSIY